MKKEITIASALLSEICLPKESSTENKGMLSDVFEKLLTSRYQGHWNSGNPISGNAFRAITSTDKLFAEAAVILSSHDGSIKSDPIHSSTSLLICVEDGFILWVDPGCVSYRERDFGHLNVIWEEFPSPLQLAASPLVRTTSPFIQASSPKFIPKRNAIPAVLSNSTASDSLGNKQRQLLQDAFKAKIQQQLLVAQSGLLKNDDLSTSHCF